MTDQPTPNRSPLREALDDVAAGIAQAWKAAKPALVLLAESHAVRLVAQEAIGHAYDEEDERLAAALDGLNAEQLRDIVAAALAVAKQGMKRAVDLSPDAKTAQERERLLTSQYLDTLNRADQETDPR